MQLEKLFISNWSGKLSGSVEFKNELGKIELTLDNEAAAALLRVCGDQLARISKKAADEMSVKVIDALVSIPSLPHAGKSE